MRRALKARGVAVFLFLVGTALPAGSDQGSQGAQAPQGPEGPAINPSIYKVPANAKTINVDCDDAKQTLSGAIADKSGVDLNIVFSGTCKEYLYVQRDGIAIRGKDATATVVGAIEVTAAKRILLEGFTCRDNAQLEYCIGALQGSSVTLHNIKIFNSSIRGVLIYNSAALIEGLTIDKTNSTSVLVRGSGVRLEGELTFSNTIEGCLVIDAASSVFSKSGVINARDCLAGIIVQSNSTFQSPHGTLNLNHNTWTGLAVISHGVFSYGGVITAKNNVQEGIFVDDESSFSAYSNLVNTSSLSLADNGRSGVYVSRGSVVELANVTSNSGSTYGVYVDDGHLRIGHSKISDNKKADVRLQFGSRAVFQDGVTVGTLSCDGTELLRGSKTPCTPDADAKPGTRTTAAKPDAAQSQKR